MEDCGALGASMYLEPVGEPPPGFRRGGDLFDACSRGGGAAWGAVLGGGERSRYLITCAGISARCSRGAGGERGLELA